MHTFRQFINEEKHETFKPEQDEVGTNKFVLKVFGNWPWPTTKNIKDDDYFYHTTLIDKLDKIKKQGLIPLKWDKKVFSDFGSEDDVFLTSTGPFYWTSSIIWNMYSRKLPIIKPILLRVKRSDVPDAKQFMKSDEWMTPKVDAEDLEYWKEEDKTWKPVNTFNTK